MVRQINMRGRVADWASSCPFALAAAVVLFLAASLAAPVHGAPENSTRRVALVIGNSAYQNVSHLPNPENDAADMAGKLAALGFDVFHLNNAAKAEMETAFADFSDTAVDTDIALVYFAGHGIEVDRQNFLIPVDARLETDRRLVFESVPLDDVMASLDAVRGVRIVLLDACRNNPFAASMKVSSATRSVGRGLSRIEAPTATLVSFAASEGAVAEDGEGRNSPFTKALLANLAEPVEIGLLFRKVRDGVISATASRQIPYVSSSLPSEPIYLVAPAANTGAAPARTPAEAPAQIDRAERAWQAVKDASSPAMLKAYIAEFDGTFYASLARARLNELEDRAAPPPPAGSEPALDTIALNREIQSELGRLGCDAGTPDGIWGRKSAAAIRKFNSHAARGLAPSSPDPDMLDTLRAIEGPVCPTAPTPAPPQPSGVADEAASCRARCEANLAACEQVARRCDREGEGCREYRICKGRANAACGLCG